MNLTNQVHNYSVGTNALYFKKERKVQDKIYKFGREKKRIKELLNNPTLSEERREILDIALAHKNAQIATLKQDLNNLLDHRKKLNSEPSTRCVRQLDERHLNDRNVVSVFESNLTRALGIETDSLTMDFIIVRVYYFQVLYDILHNGFEYKGEKYIFFSASAGQIRTKKLVMVKESSWKKAELELTCGLSKEYINSVGGTNGNKYLAYLALNGTATEEWVDFDIDRCIVVSDFETLVPGTVDYVDDATYECTRRDMEVPIPHMDGCGICLYGANKMFRAPWMKGLLANFDFIRFIQENKCSPIVKDVYGKEWNVIEDGIEIILTASQFKMWKFYKSWDEYKDNFKKYKCRAGYCNVEEDRIPMSKINYQMVQTLTDMTDEEFNHIIEPSNNKIEKLSKDIRTMLSVFGVNEYRDFGSYTELQKSLYLYPELVQDVAFKNKLRDLKNSLVKNYKACKLEIDGRYTFVIPDLYAFCQWLFLGQENPEGLLHGNEVFCNMYKDGKKLDCLRAPHLYREHAVRVNTKSEEAKTWFTTNAIYTSCHDFISKVLMFDCDGDKLMLVADDVFVECAERNMQGIVPLYYNMRKASGQQLNAATFYNNLTAAYTGGNIGEISNSITKIWNDGEITEEKLHLIKLLCMQNNEVIDYAKTLYKSTPPAHVAPLLNSYKSGRLPHFFMYAKNKKEENLMPVNDSVVNRLETAIKDKQVRFTFKEMSKFDYKKLMKNTEIEVDQEIVDKYIKFNRENYRDFIEAEEEESHDYLYKVFRDEMSQSGYSREEVTDMLVKYLFEHKSNGKINLWMLYGDIINDNLITNGLGQEKRCAHCGAIIDRFKNSKFCDFCREEHSKHIKKYEKQGMKKVICKDCGKEFEVPATSRAIRCEECKKEAQREKDRLKKKRKRA